MHICLLAVADKVANETCIFAKKILKMICLQFFLKNYSIFIYKKKVLGLGICEKKPLYFLVRVNKYNNVLTRENLLLNQNTCVGILILEIFRLKLNHDYISFKIHVDKSTSFTGVDKISEIQVRQH